MGDLDDHLRELLDRRRELPGSIAVMETHAEAAAIARHLCELENLTMRLAACWDGELDQIGAFSQIADLHEKAERPSSPPEIFAMRSSASQGGIERRPM